MSLKIAKPGEPILLTFTVPFYKTDKVVKVEIYSPGTNTTPGSLISTETLTHQSEGRYTKLYIPPYDYDFLDLVYKVYKSDGTTLDFAFSPFIQQLVLNGYSAGGYYGGGSQKAKSLSDEDYEKIASKIWEKKLDKINEKNSAAFFVKQLSEFDLESVKKEVKEVGRNLTQLFLSLQSLISGNFAKLITLPKLIKQSFEKVFGLFANENSLIKDSFKQQELLINDNFQTIKEIQMIESKIRQSIFAFNFLNIFNAKLSDLLTKIMASKEKKLQIEDFKWFFEVLKQYNQDLSSEQNQLLLGFVKDKLTETITQIDNHSIMINNILDKNSKDAHQLNNSIKNLQEQLKENEKKIQQMNLGNQIKFKELVVIFQNNILALARLLEKLEKEKSVNFISLSADLDKLKKDLNIYYV